MRITRSFCLHLFGGVALIAAAAPGFAQNAAPTSTPAGEQHAVQVIAATAAKRATNLQRAPIAINLLNAVTPQDRAVPGVRTASLFRN